MDKSRLQPHHRLELGDLPAQGYYSELSEPHIESFNYFLDHILPALSGPRPEIQRGSARHPASVAATAGAQPRRGSNPAEVSMETVSPAQQRLSCTLDVFPRGVPGKASIEAGAVEHQRLTFSLTQLRVQRPEVDIAGRSVALMPRTCREGGLTYEAPLFADVVVVIETKTRGAKHYQRTEKVFQRKLGSLPVMVRSKGCRLHGLPPRELVKAGEEPHEFGGYFIVNGNEKLIRLLIAPRANEVQALIRPSFTRIGRGYTHFATQIRCVRPREQTSITITMHYCKDGVVTVRFILGRQEFFIPLIVLLRALVDGVTDREIYERIVIGSASSANNASFDNSVADSIELLLRDTKKLGIFERTQALEYLGSRFRGPLRADAGFLILERGKALPLEMSAELKRYSGLTDRAVGERLLDDMVCVHLDDNRDKFELLLFMYEKLLALVHNRCAVDNPDSAMNHEVYLPGHLYGIFVQEKLQEYLYSLRAAVQRPFRQRTSRSSSKVQDLLSFDSVSSAFERTLDVGQKVRYFLATGNIASDSGLDLMQTSGFTIVGEKLNFLRYLSHFRSIHRGAFFTTMRTTAVRKLLPDGWGFLCPVHTPDGGPCGLLNHIALKCKITQAPIDPKTIREVIPRVMVSLGMEPMQEWSPGALSSCMEHGVDRVLWVMLDGRPIGRVAAASASDIATHLRLFKVRKMHNLPESLEIALVLPNSDTDNRGGRYAGLFLSTSPARFLRPVLHLATGQLEMIGIYEQGYLSVACLPDDIRGEGSTDPSTHIELAPTNMLDLVPNLTPFSDFNQSPRNMYQCQMGKQTMATPCHSYQFRTDNKLYRIQTPQVPICRTRSQDTYHIDEYPTGTNAIVAVISYTGYDMEDAMIINKSSYERGFAHATVYKTESVQVGDAAESSNGRSTKSGEPSARTYFHNGEVGDEGFYEAGLDEDGLVRPGTRLEKGDPLYSTLDEVTGEHHIHRWKSNEPCVVDQVRVLNGSAGQIDSVSFKYRLNRNPVIGDKFSSRHGQKGVLSQLWPLIDMPFSESGMTPDCIINPHAFPSRMTIGMLIESMAGKAGALHGEFQDATPFSFDENHHASSYFGEQLVKAGYNYFGNEVMYSGVTGVEFKADIYLGAVYYQRLRHMVKDKYQVRAGGPVNSLTQQPIKGRKKGGGVRFGEMERDSLLSHGVSFLLHDRLMNCSDAGKAYCCRHCGSVLAPTNSKLRRPGVSVSTSSSRQRRDNIQMKVVCRTCKASSGIDVIPLPYVYRYLATELAAMNINMSLTLES